MKGLYKIKNNNLTIGIFTVKNFSFYKGKYYTYGGFGNYITDFSKYFHKVILVAHVNDKKPPSGYYEINIPNIEIISLPVIKKDWQIFTKLYSYFRIASKHIHKMDIIQARMPDVTGLVGAYFARKHNIPLFNVIIDDWKIQADNVKWYSNYGLGVGLKIYLRVYDYFEKYFCKGEIVLAQGHSCYEKHKNSAKECHLILSASHQSSDVISKPTPKFCGENITLLNVGRLSRVKNQQLILNAISKLNQESSKKWNLILLGEGPKRKNLYELAEKLKILDFVIFKGKVPHKEIWKYFDECDVFVLSSISEGTPKVLLEAQARGLPIVATNIPGTLTSIQHNDNGLIFPNDNLDELIKSLKKIEGNISLSEKFSLNGLKVARKNTLEYRNKEMISIISNAFTHLNISTRLTNLPSEECH